MNCFCRQFGRTLFTLNDQVDAGIVASESIGGHARKQGRVASVELLDAQIGQDAKRQDLLADGVSALRQQIKWRSVKSRDLRYLGSLLESKRLLFMFQRMPIGFSPLASHCKTAGSPRRAV